MPADLPLNDSLRKRYAFKVGTNGVGAAVSLLTQAIVPRGLGPAAFGDFNYLTSFFTQFIGFWDPGMSQAFLTKLAQRPQDAGMVAFFWRFAVLIGLATVAFGVLGPAFPWARLLWPGQRAMAIALAAGLVCLTWAAQILGNMADAYGVTVRTEMVKMLQKLAGLALVAALFWGGRLDLTNYFLCLYAASVLLIAGTWHSLRGHAPAPAQVWSPGGEAGPRYLHEFLDYARPLLAYSIIGFLVNIVDRWLLQVFGGSQQQGFFGLAYQIGAFCFLFVGAMTPLLMREFAIAHGRADREEMARLFRRNVPVLVCVAAAFSCFVAVQADRITAIMGGSGFSAAGPAVLIMAYYPVYQAYGQLGAALFYATGQTRQYSRIGIAVMFLGLPATYFMLAPAHLHGLGWGASGLALKTLLLQFVSVNALLYFNTKYLKLSFWTYLFQQVAVLVGFTLLAVGARTCACAFPGGNALAELLYAGLTYSAALGALVWLFPQAVGLARADIEVLLAGIGRFASSR